MLLHTPSQISIYAVKKPVDIERGDKLPCFYSLFVCNCCMLFVCAFLFVSFFLRIFPCFFCIGGCILGSYFCIFLYLCVFLFSHVFAFLVFVFVFIIVFVFAAGAGGNSIRACRINPGLVDPTNPHPSPDTRSVQHWYKYFLYLFTQKYKYISQGIHKCTPTNKHILSPVWLSMYVWLCGWVMKKCVAIHCSWLPNQPDRPPFLFWHAIHCIVGPHKCAIHSMCIVEVYSMYSMFTNIFAYMQCILNMLHDWLECSDKSWQLRHTTNQPCHQIHTDLLHWKQRQSRNSSAQIGLHNTYALLILILATLGTLNANVPYIFIWTTTTAVLTDVPPSL